MKKTKGQKIVKKIVSNVDKANKRIVKHLVSGGEQGTLHADRIRRAVRGQVKRNLYSMRVVRRRILR